jgi:hypothetical protein
MHDASGDLLRSAPLRSRALPGASFCTSIQVEAASRLAHPAVAALIATAIAQAKIPLPSEGKGRLIQKSDGVKKAPPRKLLK